MSVLEAVRIGATVVLMIAAVYTDIRWNKIHNALTAPFALLGLCLMAIGGALGDETVFGQLPDRPLLGALAGLATSILGIAFGVGVWFLCNLLGRILGAGDSKLLAGIGALQGPRLLGYTMLATAIVGGVLAIVVALWRGYLKKSLATLVSSLYTRVFHKTPIDIKTAAPQARLPYAIPICLGALCSIYYVYFYLR